MADYLQGRDPRLSGAMQTNPNHFSFADCLGGATATLSLAFRAAPAPGMRDVVDGHIAVIALDRDAIVLTSDPEDIARWGVPATHIVAC